MLSCLISRRYYLMSGDLTRRGKPRHRYTLKQHHVKILMQFCKDRGRAISMPRPKPLTLVWRCLVLVLPLVWRYRVSIRSMQLLEGSEWEISVTNAVCCLLFDIKCWVVCLFVCLSLICAWKLVGHLQDLHVYELLSTRTWRQYWIKAGFKCFRKRL